MQLPVQDHACRNQNILIFTKFNKEKMITNILVPTDFSATANNALSFALNFAQKCKAEVYVLHVSFIPVTDAYFPAESYASILTEIKETAKAQFEQLRNTFKDSGFKYHEVNAAGFIYDEIKKFSGSQNIDLVVMGTTGSSGLKELLIGSNTASVVSGSDIPVLVIPPSATYHELKKIVYATDYKEPEFPAVTRLIYIAELFDAEVLVINVKAEYDRYFNESENYFVKNRKLVAFQKWKMGKSENTNIMEGINNIINNENADLLVMAKHNRSLFERIFHRSLSKRMAYHTKIPLLVLNKE